MKKIIFVFLVAVFFISCKNTSKKESSEQETDSVVETDFDMSDISDADGFYSFEDFVSEFEIATFPYNPVIDRDFFTTGSVITDMNYDPYLYPIRQDIEEAYADKIFIKNDNFVVLGIKTFCNVENMYYEYLMSYDAVSGDLISSLYFLQSDVKNINDKFFKVYKENGQLFFDNGNLKFVVSDNGKFNANIKKVPLPVFVDDNYKGVDDIYLFDLVSRHENEEFINLNMCPQNDKSLLDNTNYRVLGQVDLANSQCVAYIVKGILTHPVLFWEQYFLILVSEGKIESSIVIAYDKSEAAFSVHKLSSDISKTSITTNIVYYEFDPDDDFDRDSLANENLRRDMYEISDDCYILKMNLD